MALLKWICMLLGWMVADLLWWWLATLRVARFKRARLWRGVLLGFVLLQVAYMVMLLVGTFADHVPEMRAVLYWPVCAYVWHIFVMPASLLALSLGALIRWVRGRVWNDKKPTQQAGRAFEEGGSECRGLTRRQVLTRTAAVVVPPVVTGLVGADGLYGLGHFRVRQIDLSVPGLPADLDGLSIAHASDLHIGRFLPDGVMERVADAVNAMQADLVVFTGDLNDASQETADEGLKFIKLLDPRHGLAMIEGNHDVQRGVEFFEERMLAEGCPLLLDDGVTFHVPGRATPVQMLGISWGRMISGAEAAQVGRARLLKYRSYKEETIVELVKAVAGKREPGAFPILLAHHPHAFDTAAEMGLPLVLSGHTHGGQIMLTKNVGAGPLRFRYWSGEYSKPGSKLLVSNGIGNWFPLRVNAPGEVVKVTLRRA